MARSARTKRTTASAPPPASDSSDNDDDRSGDADDTETNEDASDPEDPEPRPEVVGPAREPVTQFTMLRELTRDYYETVIGLNKTASYALFVDQRMQSIRDFLRIKPEHIEKICTAISKQNKTNIPVMAMERLALLAYYAKHQERTSRQDKDLTNITSDDLDGLAHHMEVELNWDKKNKTPEVTPVTLDETSAHKAFSNMRLLLAGMRGHNDVPLTYVIRPRLLPPDWGHLDPNYQPRFGDVGSPYTSIDDELTLRAPILQENRREWHNFTNFETLEEDGVRTPTFNTDNAAVFMILQASWGKSPAWTNAKKFLKTKDGRQAYRTLYDYFFGKTMTASMQDRIEMNLTSYKYEGDRRGFTFETYVNKHVEQHNLHQELTEYGVAPLPDHMKIYHFTKGITDPRFASVASAILVDRERFSTFDKVKEVYLTHSRTLASRTDAAAARDRRGVSSVSAGRGHGRGRGSRHDKKSGRGTGKSRLDGIPSQVEIDRCTHIEAKRYPYSEYSKFTAAERQKHFQLMNKGVTPGTGPCRDRRHDGRSVASAGTDGSSLNRKRSASSAKMDLSDDDSKPLFPDSDTDGDAPDDRRKSNRANTRQSK